MYVHQRVRARRPPQRSRPAASADLLVARTSDHSRVDGDRGEVRGASVPALRAVSREPLAVPDRTAAMVLMRCVGEMGRN